MTDLLPCPFCGGGAFIEDNETGPDDRVFYFVACGKCNALIDQGYWSENVAIAVWNTRAQQPIIITDREGKQTVHWEPTGWQDIATAPRDGTEILGWDPTAGARVPIWFVDGEWAVCWSAEPNPDCTHWQPLPKPPEE